MLPELLAVSEGTACPGGASCGHLLGLVMSLGMANSLFSSFLFVFLMFYGRKSRRWNTFPPQNLCFKHRRVLGKFHWSASHLLTGLFIHVGEALAPLPGHLGLLLSELPSATHGSLLWDAAFLCRGGTGGVISSENDFLKKIRRWPCWYLFIHWIEIRLPQ